MLNDREVSKFLIFKSINLLVEGRCVHLAHCLIFVINSFKKEPIFNWICSHYILLHWYDKFSSSRSDYLHLAIFPNAPHIQSRKIIIFFTKNFLSFLEATYCLLRDPRKMTIGQVISFLEIIVACV